jgi:PAS domain S-box-containing protein
MRQNNLVKMELTPKFRSQRGKMSTNTEQKNYKLLVESIKDYAIIMLDTAGRIISWNIGAEQMKGYPAHEVLGKHISVCYTPEDKEKEIPQRNLKLAAEWGRFEEEGWRLRKDGSLFWADVTITALRDEQGKLVGFGKVTKDLTARKAAEAEIKRLNTELEIQLEKSQTEMLDYKQAFDEAAIVAITDQKGIIKHANDNFCKISKYSREELLGQDHRIINSGYHPKEFIRNLWTTIAHGKIWHGELKNRAKDGTHYWVDTTIIPFLDSKGKPYQYLAIRSDITARKQAEEQIQRINQELEQKVKNRTLELTHALERERELSEMKSRFVSTASHEFRTPLSTILSSLALLEHYSAPEHEAKKRKHFERIQSSVKNLTDILDRFLSLEKLEQGRVEANAVDFNLCEFVREIVEEMEETAKHKNQHIRFSYTGAEGVCQDKKILRNVLLNLISNALKYSKKDKEISVDIAEKCGGATISVKDEGIGIPEDAQKELFGKFFRASNAINIQGTGLGLSIVKKYVELLNGTIHFTSKVNEGTTFVVSFPGNKRESA